MVTGNMEAARKTYELWRQLYPRDQFAVGNLGVVYAFLGEYDKALAAHQEAWRLDPGNALQFSNVVVAYLHLNWLDEAKATAMKAIALHLDNNLLHGDLYQLDFVQHDTAGMEKEAAELIGKPGWEDLMFYNQSDTAAYHGHFSQARELTRHAVDSAQRADKKETAAAYEAEAAVREALVGNLALAKRHANNALALSNGKEVVALSATALGLAGDSAQSARLARDLNARFPQDTVVQSNLLPTIRLCYMLPYNLGVICGWAAIEVLIYARYGAKIQGRLTSCFGICSRWLSLLLWLIVSAGICIGTFAIWRKRFVFRVQVVTPKNT